MTATISEALDGAAARLRTAGIDNPRLEARLLVGHALGVGPEIVLTAPDRRLDDSARRALDGALARRSRREPMAYILGRREFWSLVFQVTPDTLDPRPDSEAVVEAALAYARPREGAYARSREGEDARSREGRLRVLDLGTGSGCLLLALLSELPGADGLGVDISAGAIAVARANAAALGLAARARFEIADWDDGVGGRFDLIVANPPYLRSAEIEALAPEVAEFEPRRALDGGGDGLDCYRTIAPALRRRLSADGVAVIELGAGQAESVAAIMTGAGLDKAGKWNDLSGVQRCLVLRRRPGLTGR